MNLNRNKNNIIFAPNCFGKTVKANSLYEELNQNDDVEIFTAKKMKDLIGVQKVEILVGESVPERTENRKISTTNKKELEKGLTNYANKYYKEKNARGLQNKSYFFNKTKSITNFKDSFQKYINIFDERDINTNIDVKMLDVDYDSLIRIDKELKKVIDSGYQPLKDDERDEKELCKVYNTEILADEQYDSIKILLNLAKRRKTRRRRTDKEVSKHF